MLKNKWMKTALAVTILGGGANAITSHVFAANGTPAVPTVNTPEKAAVADTQDSGQDGEVTDDKNVASDKKEVADDQNRSLDAEVADTQETGKDAEVVDDNNAATDKKQTADDQKDGEVQDSTYSDLQLSALSHNKSNNLTLTVLKDGKVDTSVNATYNAVVTLENQRYSFNSKVYFNRGVASVPVYFIVSGNQKASISVDKLGKASVSVNVQ